MKITSLKYFLLLAFFCALGCQQHLQKEHHHFSGNKNVVKYAKGLAIYNYSGFSILIIKDPWPNAAKDYTYVLKKKNVSIPDSIANYPVITIPLKSVVITSTTHIPSLEMLEVENTIVGFPHTDYISSIKTRKLVESGKINEVGTEQSLNTERLIDLEPNAIIAHGIDNNNPTFDNLQKSGLQVIFNGDWNETTPLGKAEWIKFFGALYDEDEKAARLFESIVKTYKQTSLLAKSAKSYPTVFSGAIFQNQWFMPQGNSWAASILKDAHGNYLWNNTSGTGSLSLSFEAVFDKAGNADYWIGPGQYNSLSELSDANPHYTEFKAFKDKNVYSYSTKTGKTGGLIYYELAPNRPDLVLQDMLKILHPELLPNYQLQFFEKLK
jgi:iron complex transport system substrate-binding protein